MEVKLIVVDGKSNRRQVKLKLPADIGRSRQAKLTIGHARVSRQHCQLVERNGFVVVKDLGSLNGTFVDGDRVTEAVIKPGERLTIGPLTFQVEYEAPAETAEVAGDDGEQAAFLGGDTGAETAEAAFDVPTEQTPAVSASKPSRGTGAEPDFDFLADEGPSEQAQPQDVPSFDDEEAPAAEADELEFEAPAAAAGDNDDTWEAVAPPSQKAESGGDAGAVDDELFDLDDQPAADEEPVGGSLWERALGGVDAVPESAAAQDEDVFPTEDVVPVDEDAFAAEDEEEGPANDESASGSDSPALDAAPEPAPRPRSGGRGGSDAVDFSFLMDDAAYESDDVDEAVGDEPAASGEQDFYADDAAASNAAAPAADSDFEQPWQDVAVEDGPADEAAADEPAAAEEDLAAEDIAEDDAADELFAAEDAEQPAGALADSDDAFDSADADEVAPAAETSDAQEPVATDSAFDDLLDEELPTPAEEVSCEVESEAATASSRDADGTPDFGFLMGDADAEGEQPAEDPVAEDFAAEDLAAEEAAADEVAETPTAELPEGELPPASEEPAAESPAAEDAVSEASSTVAPAAEAPATPEIKQGKPLKGKPLKGRPFKRPAVAQAPPVAEEPIASTPASELEPALPTAAAEVSPPVASAPPVESLAEEAAVSDEGGMGHEADDPFFNDLAEQAGEGPTEESATLDGVVEESLAAETPAEDAADSIDSELFASDEPAADEAVADEAAAEGTTAEEIAAEGASADTPEFTGFDAARSSNSVAARKPAKKEKRGFWLFNLFGKKDKAKGGKASQAVPSSNGRATEPAFAMPAKSADEAAQADQEEPEAVLPEEAISEDASFEPDSDLAFETIDEAESTNGVYSEAESIADEAFDIDEEVPAFDADFEQAAEEQSGVEAEVDQMPAAGEQETSAPEAASQASDDDSPDDALSQFLKGFK